MKKYNWVAQDEDGCVYTYDKKPECSPNGNWRRVTVPNSDHRKMLKGDRNPNWKESIIDLSKNDYIIKDGILMATRQHAALIHAWADGAEIQFFNTTHNKWDDVSDNMPCWAESTEYRIKPNTKTVKFRNWYATNGRVYGTYCAGECNNPDFVTWLGDWQEVEAEL